MYWTFLTKKGRKVNDGVKIAKDREIGKTGRIIPSEMRWVGWLNLTPSRHILQVEHISNMYGLLPFWTGPNHKAS